MKFNINDIIHVLKSEGVVHEEDIITGAPRIKKKVSYIEIDEDHDDDDIVYYLSLIHISSPRDSR